MNKINTRWGLLLASIGLSLPSLFSVAQNSGPAIEQWRSFLPYNQVTGVAIDGTTFFCATQSGFFTYDRTEGTMTPYSKVNGMSDIGLSGIAIDVQSGYAVLGYVNSNIDLFRDHRFYNLPDLKLAQVSGDKTIHHIIARDKFAYLSSGVGLVIINLDKREVKETVAFYEQTTVAPVYATALSDGFIYAATSVGLFRTPVNNPSIQNYATWTKLQERELHYLAVTGEALYGAFADSVFKITTEDLSFAYKTRFPVSHLDPGTDGLWVSAAKADGNSGYGILLTAEGSVSDSFVCTAPSQILQLANGEVWFGDQGRYQFTNHHGLRKKIDVTQNEAFYPQGPVTPFSYDISAHNGELWVAHGGKTRGGGPSESRAMFSSFQNDTWKNYPWLSDNEFVQDFICILKDQNTGKVYAGSYSGGLLVLQPDGSWEVYNKGYMPNTLGDTATYLLSGFAMDEQGNLWMTNYSAANELTVLTRDGKWYQGRSVQENNSGNPTHSAADIVVDDYGQKWFIAPANSGAIVYNDNGTLENNSDDQYRVLRSGEGAGNLPENRTLSIAKDKDGAIWIGTANGIGIVYCPDQVISRQCEATMKVVRNADGIDDYLFVNQSVRSIAVDAANRKWIGTPSGAWLVSEDGEKIIYQFTEENSPLPSNYIQRINIDPVTGDVYFSTDKGIASFRSTATEGGLENESPLLIYPNPVPSGYGGMIAVRGVSENADVRFTDISGQLVYRTNAFGGQAVWNGKDYTGRKVQSGVYLIFVVNKDGTQKTTGKLIIHE